MSTVIPRTTHETASGRSTGDNTPLWFLMLGNVIIGAGVLAPSAMINGLTGGLNVSPVAIGALIGWGAVVLGVGAPTLALATGAAPRRSLLAACLAVYCVGHAASALATDYSALMIARLLMIAAAAVYTPQAASAVALMVPEQRRASAVAFVFMGWPMATAVMSPLLSIVAETLGWRAGYWILSIGAALALAGVMWRTPKGLYPAPISLRAWAGVITKPAIVVLLLATLVQVAGQFTLFAYLAAELKRASQASAAEVAIGLSLYGVAGLAGSLASARFVGRIGAPSTQLACQAFMTVGLLGWTLFSYNLPLAMVSIFIWGLGFGGGVSMQQARLITVAPLLASASVALNTSFLYVGQATGAALGGSLIGRGLPDWLGAAGCLLMLAAMALSFTARKVFKA
jgi:predicted MFS family arabinose efflux permease